MIHKIIKGLSIIIALLLIIYIGFLKWPKASINSKEVTAEISAGDLFEAFNNDEQKAEVLYLGKALVVSGVIDDKYNDETGAPVLILNSEDGSPAALVTLEKTEASKLSNYNIGDQIKIKAQCSGLIMEVTLGKGIIIE